MQTVRTTGKWRWLMGLLLLVCGRAMAHPHVWVDYTASFQVQGSMLTGIRQTWLFRRGFPVRLAVDSSIQIPRDGKLDAHATAAFRTQAFDSLKSADYFNHVFVAGQPARFGAPQDFAVSVDNNRIVYSFVLPLATPVDMKKGGDLVIGIWDPSFFVNFEIAPGIDASSPWGLPAACKISPFRDDVHRIFDGSVRPLALRIAC